MSLGTIIRCRREEMGLTQEQLACQSGISKPYLSNIETGKAKNPPSNRVLRSLEKSLRFSSGELRRIGDLQRTPTDVRLEHESMLAEIQKLRTVVKGMMTQTARDQNGKIDLDRMSKLVGEPMETDRLAAGVMVPVINSISAGYPVRFESLDYPAGVAKQYFRCPDLHDAKAFAVRVVGDHMEPRYNQGDVVIFSPGSPAKSGQDCFVRLAPDDRTTFRRCYRDTRNILRLQPLNDKYPAEMFAADQVTGIWPAVLRIETIM